MIQNQPSRLLPRFATAPAARCAQAAALLACLLIAHAASADSRFPAPPSVRKRADFWKKVYTEAETNSGYLHDAKDLSVIYEKVQIGKSSGRALERKLRPQRNHYKKILRKLATGRRSGLSTEEQRVLNLFPAGTSNRTFSAAATRVRFQLGQADRMRKGLERMGRWEGFIRQTLKKEGVPEELVALPLVESSYNPRAYSHAGASGMWQFTRPTGRLFMRVNHYIDERRDPFLSSLSAAKLLKRNHELTRAWPLAITAYNHGAAGVRRAVKRYGTRDIGTITEKYKSRTFGFASRNFYASFLAALEVSQDPEAYFGPIRKDPPEVREVVVLDTFYQAGDLARALGTDSDELKRLNPALLKPIWRTQKYVPKGYALRVPAGVQAEAKIAGLAPKHRHARQIRDKNYRVRRGDTLGVIARRFGVSESALVTANGLRNRNRIRVGQILEIPGKARSRPHHQPQSPVASTPAPDFGGQYRVRRGDTLEAIARRYGTSIDTLVRANRLQSRHRISVGQVLKVPGSATASAPTAAGEPPRIYTVRRGDSLHRIANRHGTTIQRLVDLNGLRRNAAIHPGQKLRLFPDPKPPAPSAVAEQKPAPAKAPAESKPTREVAEARANSEPATAEAEAPKAAPVDPKRETAPALAELETAEAPQLAELAKEPAPGLSEMNKAVPPPSPQLDPAPILAKTSEIQNDSPSEPLPALDDVAGRPTSKPGATSVGVPAASATTAAEVAGAATSEVRAELPKHPTRYGVSDGRIHVQPEETLGHYADWLQIPTQSLRSLNGIRGGRPLRLGARVRLDFSKVSVDEFEARRLAYHREIQTRFYASYEIAGTREHVLRKGDTLWELSRGGGRVPIWLLQDHNPSVDFGALQPGERVIIPKVTPDS